MSNITAIDDMCGPTDRILRHERELSYLTTITEEIKENNRSIAISLENINENINDLKVIKEGMKDVVIAKDKIFSFHEIMYELNNNIRDIKDDIEDNTISISKLEESTSHLGWLNKGIKTTAENFGIIVVVGVLSLFFMHWTGILKTIDIFKG